LEEDINTKTLNPAHHLSGSKAASAKADPKFGTERRGDGRGTQKELLAYESI